MLEVCLFHKEGTERENLLDINIILDSEMVSVARCNSE